LESISTIGVYEVQFIFDGEIYKVIKITGPAHNMLGLSFVENNSVSNSVEIIPLQAKNDEASNISASEVQQQVVAAITEMNAKFRINYKVAKIQFVPSDTPATNIYKELAIELINRVIMKGKFIRV